MFTSISPVCPDGYVDVNCSKTCYPGLYGKECLHPCPSECKNTCHHVTGDCPETTNGYLKISTSVPVGSSAGLLDETISQKQQRMTNAVKGASKEYILQAVQGYK
ncbi:multiple epidermal growth factor-like domains protein 11 [Ostrea edulis]|uniref:multiple epidermal growth factor-like domains protein 11 n=1 Tax=Ostrea edulis TaxID=37623 RepID=UPI0024AFCEF4|nr:multiple epidermal growth factor-like domains protein 11 [Ostrea edulis]